MRSGGVHLECWQRADGDSWYLAIRPTLELTIHVPLDHAIGPFLAMFPDSMPAVYFRDPGRPRQVLFSSVTPPRETGAPATEEKAPRPSVRRTEGKDTKTVPGPRTTWEDEWYDP